MQALAVLLALVAIGLVVSGFVLYSKIPDNARNYDQNIALTFATLGIPLPFLQIVPIVIGSRYTGDNKRSFPPAPERLLKRS